MSVRLCVTADDFGLAACVDAAIVRLARAGRVDAVSVMAHPAARLDGAGALRDSGVSTGLHLVLAGEGAPLRSAALLLARDRRRLRRSIEAQLARFLDAGLRLDFVNGHQHLHAVPGVWSAIADVVRAPAVRWTLGARGSWRRRLVALSSRSARPDALILSPLEIGAPPSLAGVEALLSSARDERGVIAELIVHPADPGSDLGQPRGWGAPRRARERDLLESPAFEAMLRARARRSAPRASCGAFE